MKKHNKAKFDIFEFIEQQNKKKLIVGCNANKLKPWYNKIGDQIEIDLEPNRANYAEWINPYLTIFKSLDGKRVAGVTITNIKKLLKEK